MREMLHVTAAIVGEGLSESVALITDGRFSGRHARLHGRAHRAGGVEGRPASQRCARATSIVIDVETQASSTSS